MNREMFVEAERNPALGATEPPVVRFLAQVFSYLFHPLFIPLYVCWFIEFVHPSYFSGFSEAGKKRVLLQITINVFIFPALSVLLLKGLGFIDSLFLKSQRDRIIPYIASMTFFFWAQYALREQPEIPRIVVAFLFGVFISSAAALIANIYFKVSMHGIGMGGLVGIFYIIMQQNTMLMTWPLSVALLIAGLVATSRFIVSDHTQKEMYSGLLIGFLCQIIGAAIQL